MKSIIKITIKFLILLLLLTNTGFSQIIDWIKTNGGGQNGYESIFNTSVDVDESGNVYTVGFSNYDAYLKKRNSSGTDIWTNSWSGTLLGNRISIQDLDCDNAGNVYITGYYNGPVTFGSFTLSDNYASYSGFPKHHMFVAKYNTSGVCLWAKSATDAAATLRGSGTEIAPVGTNMVIAVDNSGNCFVSGTLSGQFTADGINSIFGSSLSNNLNSKFLIKYNSVGNYQWLRCIESQSGTYQGENAKFGDIAIDPNGNVLLTGTFHGYSGEIITFHDGNNLYSQFFKTGNNGDELFYVKISNSGNYIYGKWGIGGSSTDTKGYGIGTANSSVYLLSNHDIFKLTNDGINDGSSEAKYSLNGVKPNSLKIDNLGNSYVCGDYTGTIFFDYYSISGVNGLNNTFVLKIDQNLDEALWLTGFSATELSVKSNNISPDKSDNVFITGNYNGSAIFGSNNFNSSNYFENFVTKISTQANIIAGLVYFDNGTYDPFPNIIISPLTGNPLVSSNSSGEYYSYCGAGSQSVYIPNPPLYYTPVYPSNLPVVFSSTGDIEIADIGLQPTLTINDLRITVTDISRARPGFQTTYRVTFKNVGTTTITPSNMTLAFDTRLPYPNSISYNPLVNVISGTSNPVTWSFNTPLKSQDEGSVDLTFTVPTNLLGANLVSTANINPTDVTSDNQSILNQTVTGSYDPNDKSVLPAGGMTIQNVQAETPLTYTIRFQNTGTDTAFTVKITDSISSKLNLFSVETISASHNYKFSIVNGNKLVWTFNNILLPDSTTNEPKSHGFVKFRIKPKNNLVIGDVINNSSNIYFDFNDPVITNTAITQIINPSPKMADVRYRLQFVYPVLDSVKVYLASSLAPFQKIDSSTVIASLSSSKFIARALFTQAQNGVPYYIVVKHRNSIETWSGIPVTFSTDSTLYDFTTSRTKAFGNNMLLVSSSPIRYGFYGGDVNNDGVVDISDVSIINNKVVNFASGYVVSDINGDGIVDGTDINLAYNNSLNFVSMIKP